MTAEQKQDGADRGRVEVALPVPLHQTFTYQVGEGIKLGTRVRVPFGNRQLVGVVVEQDADRPPAAKDFKVKAVAEVLDETPSFAPPLLELARWLSRYYQHPIGEVFKTMLPAASKKVLREVIALTDRGLEAVQANLIGDADIVSLQNVFAKRRSLAKSTVVAKLRASSLGMSLYKEWVRTGLVTVVSSTQEVGARRISGSDKPTTVRTSDDLAPDHPKELSEEQSAALTAILDAGLRAPSPRPFLLHGVTGSGKTEVYLQLIAEADGQALVLVPEISLTPQMTLVFERRFPAQVAVVHSAMSDAERWEQLENVRSGQAKILIGPRSAVFGPFQDLQLVIVDEEHDNSYKQSTGLSYHARDVAVLRAKLEGATIVLGSATPSLESFHNAQTGKYHYLRMASRVSGASLPEVTLISSLRSQAPGVMLEEAQQSAAQRQARAAAHDDLIYSSATPIAKEIITALRDNLARGEQAIVLVNRRGYAYYLFGMQQREAVQCPHCSISLTLHERSTKLHCHYCDFKVSVAQVIADHPEETYIAFGYGSEKAEDSLRESLPGARIRRLDSDTASRRHILSETLAEFRRGEVDILVGTQILAKGHDFPKVTLIVLLEVDQLLNLPDFRAGERTFQLIVQAAGRAGRAELPGRVFIQSLRTKHPIIQAAISQDFHEYAQRELAFRESHDYPPFHRMAAVEFSSTDRNEVSSLERRIQGWLEQMHMLDPDLMRNVQVLGPAKPPIETIRRRHRRTVLVSGQDVTAVHAMAGRIAAAFAKQKGDLRMKLDFDPQSLL